MIKINNNKKKGLWWDWISLNFMVPIYIYLCDSQPPPSATPSVAWCQIGENKDYIIISLRVYKQDHRMS